MLSSFCVYHKPNPTGGESTPPGVQATFKTCLRLIHFTMETEDSSLKPQVEYEVFKGSDAYQFVLEVICGLHSPVVGETEVFGQFRNFRQNGNFEHSLSQIFSQLISDTKKVRGEFLLDLGGQSYGSLLRKEVKKISDVALIGGGSFTQDILPWIYKNENSITLYVRNLEKAQKQFSRQFPRLKYQKLEETPIHAAAVIVAAPVSAKILESCIENKSALIFDLRGESRVDRCTQFSSYKDLDSFFSVIETNQMQISLAKAKALVAIDQISQQRYFVESFRPFGWDDICVW